MTGWCKTQRTGRAALADVDFQWKSLTIRDKVNGERTVPFSFTDNNISVEGITQFSESSTVVLRHLFHVALLSASTRIPAMRFPRFLLLDGIEDGGMELARSHRLQETIVDECSRFDCEYQLIFATSQIAPQLDVENFVVARSFSEEQRSLQIL